MGSDSHGGWSSFLEGGALQGAIIPKEQQKSSYIILNLLTYPLVNVYKTMENHHAINGKTDYFYGHVQ